MDAGEFEDGPGAPEIRGALTAMDEDAGVARVLNPDSSRERPKHAHLAKRCPRLVVDGSDPAS
jgi:hypothetical protein